MKIVNAQNNVLTLEVKSETGNGTVYATRLNVKNGDHTCTCPQFVYRVSAAANLLKVTPNAKTAVSCKHGRKAHETLCA